jgi:hypothetical protein
VGEGGIELAEKNLDVEAMSGDLRSAAFLDRWETPYSLHVLGNLWARLIALDRHSLLTLLVSLFILFDTCHLQL